MLIVDRLWPGNGASDFRVPRTFRTSVKTCGIPADVRPGPFTGFSFCPASPGVIGLRESGSPPFGEFSENML